MKTRSKYNRSFARRLTRWLVLVLFIMMGGLAFIVYFLSKGIVVERSGSNLHNSIQMSCGTISDVMSDVSVAVQNNIFDIERHLSQPDQLQAIVERIVRQNPRIHSCGISFIENYYPQKGRTFCPYACRDDSVPTTVRSVPTYTEDYLKDDWFMEAVAKDSAYWSKPFFVNDVKMPLVPYLYPIHDQKGRVVAILGADLPLDFMAGMLQKQDSIFLEESWSIQVSEHNLFNSHVIANDGTYITHTDQRRILKANFFVHVKDLYEPGVAQEIIRKMTKGEKSNDEVSNVVLVNRYKSYLFFSPIEGTDWMLAVSVSTWIIDAVGDIVGFLMLVIMVIMLLVTLFVCRLAISRAAKPLRQLAATADRVAGGQFNAPLPAMKSRDEIHLLRDSFENMQHSIGNYMEELKRTTTAKASMESELKIAHDIQMSMLPKTYPAFPDRHDIDIYGLVMPAKAVGGDLYDFFIRDEKLFFCIGDVSGKGVPASLVMAVTRSLFRNIAAYTQEADHIVLALNDALSNNNDTGMFVTLFIGVLDLANGHLNYTNAGHNPPLLISGGNVINLPCHPNIPVGVLEGWQFDVQQYQMAAGDTLFLYTDGLNEAEDSQHRQYEMQRVRQVAANADSHPQSLIEAMTTSVRQFVGDAEQSDDLTMLAVQYAPNITE